jgi:DNA repair exonuclease SbcCD ATPase subunit
VSKDIIKKFLAEAQAHPDSTPVRIGDQELTLGDLRALDKQEREELNTRLANAKKLEEEVKTRQGEVLDLSKKAQAAYDAAVEAQKKAGTPPPASGADPFADPWLAPVKKALDERDAKIGELTNAIKQMVTVVGNAANTFSEDRWDRQYQTIDFGKREKKPTRDEILQYAKDNKILDRFGLPSIAGAWDKMSEADRLEEVRKAEREKGREEGRMEVIASRLPVPGTPGAGPAITPKIPANGDILGDLYADSLKDPELKQLLEQLN